MAWRRPAIARSPEIARDEPRSLVGQPAGPRQERRGEGDVVLCLARQRGCDFFFRRSARGGRCEASATSAASCSATRCRPQRRGSARLDLGQPRRAFPAGVSRRRHYRRGLRRGVLSAPPAPPAPPREEAAAAAAATATRRGCETSARSTRRSRRSTCSWGGTVSVSLYDEFFFLSWQEINVQLGEYHASVTRKRGVLHSSYARMPDFRRTPGARAQTRQTKSERSGGSCVARLGSSSARARTPPPSSPPKSRRPSSGPTSGSSTGGTSCSGGLLPAATSSGSTATLPRHFPDTSKPLPRHFLDTS